MPFIYWAQALDNSSPDHIEVRGQELEADDTVHRQDAVSRVSGVVKLGNRVFESSGVSLTADNKHFIIEVPAIQRDQAGRTAPIVCFGEYDHRALSEVIGTSVATGLTEFAARIGRTIQIDHLDHVKESFKILKKKSNMTRLARGLTIWAIIVVLLALVYWMAYERS